MTLVQQILGPGTNGQILYCADAYYGFDEMTSTDSMAGSDSITVAVFP